MKGQIQGTAMMAEFYIKISNHSWVNAIEKERIMKLFCFDDRKHYFEYTLKFYYLFHSRRGFSKSCSCCG